MLALILNSWFFVLGFGTLCIQWFYEVWKSGGKFPLHEIPYDWRIKYYDEYRWHEVAALSFVPESERYEWGFGGEDREGEVYRVWEAIYECYNYDDETQTYLPGFAPPEGDE
jgi:hypothetical protein